MYECTTIQNNFGTAQPGHLRFYETTATGSEEMAMAQTVTTGKH